MKANVVLTYVELSGLLIIIFIGLWAIGAAAEMSRVLEFRTSGTGSMLWPVIAADDAGVLCHRRLRGLGEHRRDAGPDAHLPILLTGLGITG